MAALFIFISLDVLVESVRSFFPRVILIGSISIEVPVALEVGAAAVASPVGVLELDTHSSSEADPSESSPPPVSVAPMDIPIGRLYCTHPDGPCKALPLRKSVRPLPSFIIEMSAPLSTMYPSTTFESSAEDSSSKSYAGPSCKRCRSPAVNVISSIHATRALVHSCVDLLPSRKRFKDSILPEDSVEEDIDTDVLEDIEADATAVEDEVEDEVESSNRGTMEVGLDAVAGIDIYDGMLMPDAVESLEQVEEGLQDIYDHVIEIPLQRIEDIETGQKELEARSLIAGGERASLLEQVTSLERSNARLQGIMMMERARSDRFWQHVRFTESELRQTRRFRYYDMMRFRRLEIFTVRHLGFRP
nr:hypothetical protein [Tanacetum cinerariifolium]